MGVMLFVTLCNILPVILAQVELINEDLGEIHFHAQAGRLPQKYQPLSEKDQGASEKAIDVMDFIQLVPNIDPFKHAALGPFGIDLPFLWLSGNVYLKNIVVSGVKQLVVNSLEVRLRNIRTDLNISLPLVYVEGDFYLQVSISFLPLMFSCHFSTNLMDMNILVSSGSVPIQAPPVGEVLQVTSADVQVDIRNVQLNLTNMVISSSHEEEDRFGIITQLFDEEESNDNIFDNLLKSALKLVNEQLLTVSTDVFKSYLLSDY